MANPTTEPTRRDTLLTQTKELNRAAVAAMSCPFHQWRIGTATSRRLFEPALDRTLEAVAAADAAGLGIYAPLKYEAVRLKGDRRKTLVVTPLLGSYVFAHTDSDRADDVFRLLFDGTRASALPGPDGYPMTISGTALLAFVNANKGRTNPDRAERLVANELRAEPERPYAVGTRLRVRSGPLDGIDGECAGYRGREVIVRVDFLNSLRNAYFTLDAVELFA